MIEENVVESVESVTVELMTRSTFWPTFGAVLAALAVAAVIVLVMAAGVFEDIPGQCLMGVESAQNLMSKAGVCPTP